MPSACWNGRIWVLSDAARVADAEWALRQDVVQNRSSAALPVLLRRCEVADAEWLGEWLLLWWVRPFSALLQAWGRKGDLVANTPTLLFPPSLGGLTVGENSSLSASEKFHITHM